MDNVETEVFEVVMLLDKVETDIFNVVVSLDKFNPSVFKVTIWTDKELKHVLRCAILDILKEFSGIVNVEVFILDKFLNAKKHLPWNILML